MGNTAPVQTGESTENDESVNDSETTETDEASTEVENDEVDDTSEAETEDEVNNSEDEVDIEELKRQIADLQVERDNWKRQARKHEDRNKALVPELTELRKVKEDSDLYKIRVKIAASKEIPLDAIKYLDGKSEQEIVNSADEFLNYLSPTKRMKTVTVQGTGNNTDDATGSALERYLRSLDQ